MSDVLSKEQQSNFRSSSELLRKKLPLRCKRCDGGLQNSMEQLVGLCPFCFRIYYVEPRDNVD